MNELNIQNIDNYTCFDTLLLEKDESFFTNKFICPKLFEMCIWSYKDSNNKIKFGTRPCSCFVYDSDLNVENSYFSLIINNDITFNFRNKILSGDITYCKNCPIYKDKDIHFMSYNDLIYYFGKYGEEIYYHLKYGKKLDLKYNPILLLSLDNSCNLKCTTCRKDYIHSDMDYSSEQIEEILQTISNSVEVTIGTDGETFLNPIYKTILATDLNKGKLKRINFFTNAQLLNETNWNKIHTNTRKIINKIWISFDSSCKDTYENKIRLGGNWENLMKNLDYLNSVKGNIKMCTSFTISKYNYNEVIPFMDLAKSKGFNEVVYSFSRPMITNEKITDFMITDNNQKQDIIKTLELIKENNKDMEISII